MKLKGKRYLMIALILFVMAFSLIALEAATGSPSGQPSWFEHVDLMQVTIGGLFLIVLWFMIRTLRKIDANQALLFKKIDDLCAEFYELRGEHKAMKERCNKGK
jgi:uncharacterized membrane protein YhdT